MLLAQGSVCGWTSEVSDSEDVASDASGSSIDARHAILRGVGLCACVHGPLLLVHEGKEAVVPGIQWEKLKKLAPSLTIE